MPPVRLRPGAARIIVTLDQDIIDFVDDESFKRERKRSWMVQEALDRWRKRLAIGRSRTKRREENQNHETANKIA